MNIMWNPSDYSRVAVLANEVGKEILHRLEWMSLKPKIILDVGCGIGEQSKLLRDYYPDAQVISLDLSVPMLQHGKKNSAELYFVCADNNSLPIANHSIDLVVAHFFLPWQIDLTTHLREWRRILRQDGLLLTTTFGPDTLKGFPLNTSIHKLDMHDLGDLLLREKFLDPVLDTDYFTLTYSDQAVMLKEQHVMGFIEMVPEQISEDFSHLKDDQQKFTLPYEIVFAHAFAPGPQARQETDGTVKIPVSILKDSIKR